MIWCAQRWGWCRGRVSRKLKEARWESPGVGGEGGVSYCLYIVIDRKVCILAEIRVVKRRKFTFSKQSRMPVSAIMDVIDHGAKLYYLEWEFCAALPLTVLLYRSLRRRQASTGVSVFKK